MHPSAVTTDSEATYIDNVQKAQELRKKAQQLAKDELAVLNQAVDLNLLARQLAEATMRPTVVHTPTSVPFYISLPAGMGNPAFRMQLMRAQQAALGGTAAQYIQNLQSSSPAAAASPAVASSGQGLPPLFAAAGGAAAPAGSSDPSAAAAGIDAQQSAARQTTAQAAADTLQQPPSEQLQQQQQDVAAAADPTASLQQLQAQQLGGPELQSTLDVQQTASEAPAGSEHTPDAVDGAAHTSMDLDS